MFGTLGFSELIIILVIVLIIFGAGRLPGIGEGVGKALKGFKKEVNEIPPMETPPDQTMAGISPEAQGVPQPVQDPNQASAPASPTQQPYQPGTEQTPGTTAAMAYSGLRPEVVQPKEPSAISPGPAPAVVPAYEHAHQPVTMEERASQSAPQARGQYPPLPPTAINKPGTKRPSAVVNKDAVARVQAQRAAIQSKSQKPASGSPDDMQSLGEGLGDALRTFRQATADVRNSLDPEMRTIQAELDSAQKEVEQSIEAAKQPILPKEPSSPA
jgi:TatA/E family protein of Tat protein translocase